MTTNYGKGIAQRTCAAADRTGHALLHTLYQRNIAARTQFFDEFFALDLIRDADGYVLGVTVSKGARSASASTTLTVMSGALPLIAVQGLATPLALASNRLTLIATVSSRAPATVPLYMTCSP